jgi:hypothetical protein
VIDIIGETFGWPGDLIVLPVARFDPAFWDLRTGHLGEAVQKFTNYGIRVAFVGDLSGPLETSRAFRDFVGEANRGGRLLFAPDLVALEPLL